MYAEDGCGKFAWSLTAERAAFAKPQKASVDAGATLNQIPADAFVLHLRPDHAASFTMPPERKPKAEHWFGAAVHFPAPPLPGIYQVTLSDEAWIDVVQSRRYAHAVGNTGRSDCPGVRKSLRLELSGESFVLQLSGVASDTINVSLHPMR